MVLTADPIASVSVNGRKAKVPLAMPMPGPFQCMDRVAHRRVQRLRQVQRVDVVAADRARQFLDALLSGRSKRRR
nr:hypothetical protein GCM10010200_082010 [Actinomadura rugatobispora]